MKFIMIEHTNGECYVRLDNLVAVSRNKNNEFWFNLDELGSVDRGKLTENQYYNLLKLLKNIDGGCDEPSE